MDLKDYNIPYSGWKLLINEWIIGENAKRDREILILNLLDGIPLESLYKVSGIDISARQASRIIEKRLPEVISHIDFLTRE